MNQLPIRGVLAPAFMALGIAAGILDLQLDRPSLVWLGLVAVALGLVFARDSSRLLASAFKNDDA